VKSGRWLIVVDDLGEKRLEGLMLDSLLDLNATNRALVMTSRAPLSSSFDSEFSFGTEFFLGARVLTAVTSLLRVAHFAPSFPVLRQLLREGTRIDDLTWRQFEKLIAALLEAEGYEVELMRGTKDGGVDVVAVRDFGVGAYYKALWQAKKNRQNRKVGLSVVRELADTRQEFGANKGVIVTSSYLTRGALQRIDREKFLLGKVDRDDLSAWIDRTLLDIRSDADVITFGGEPRSSGLFARPPIRHR
jgi:restriction system protein